MNQLVLSFAFLAGLQAFFAPCSIALIPAYIGFYVREQTEGGSRLQQLLFGLKAGSFASLGLITVYISFGLIFTILGSILTPIIPWIELTAGSLLLFLGSATLLGYEFVLQPPVIFLVKKNGVTRFYFFGVTYALGAIGCTLPIFLLVIFQALAQKGVLGSLLTFLVYTITMVSLMITFSLIAAVSKTAIQKFLTKYMLTVQKSAGVLILFAGIYLVYLALKVILI